MMSMDRIAETTSESHVQRKLSSRKWPSLSVGLIKSNFILIFSILITCFAGTIAQNAFPMEFASNATTNVKPGTPVNLTCSFKLIKDDFQNILFKLGAAQLYDYRSQGSFKGLQHDHFLSTNPNVDSVFWMTTKTSFCSDSSLNREYMCWVQNAAREFTQENVEVSYQGPSLEVIVGGKLIKNVGSTYSVILPHDQMNKDIEIKIVAKNVLNATSMKLSIEEGALPAEVTTNDDETLCIYERELIAMYKFPISGEYDLKYSGPPHDATIKVTVKDVPTTTTTTTVKTTTPGTTMPSIPPVVVTTPTPLTDDGKSIKDDDDDLGEADEYRGLGGGWIALIIIVVILFLIGLLCIYFFVISKNKEENKKRVRDYLPISNA